jgi:hypothetical protein
MQRRYLVVALALVVALVAITPTLGSSGNQSLVDRSTFPVRTAKKAKEIAKRAKAIANQALTAAQVAQATAETAQQLANDAQAAADAAKQSADAAQASANTAKTSADTAKSAADAAQTSANNAQTSANNAQASADAVAAQLTGLRSKSDTEPATVTTSEENAWVDLGGPSVTVTAPASGLIEVIAQADVDDDGAVTLFEDGQQVPDQDPNGFCDTNAPLTDVLLSNSAGPGGPVTLATPGGAGFLTCGVLGAPGPNVFKTSPGSHTYELRYADCGCSGADAAFNDRTLTVAPRP